MLPCDCGSFPQSLPPNRRPVRTRASGPLGATLCNQHSNYGTCETKGRGNQCLNMGHLLMHWWKCPHKNSWIKYTKPCDLTAVSHTQRKLQVNVPVLRNEKILIVSWCGQFILSVCSVRECCRKKRLKVHIAQSDCKTWTKNKHKICNISICSDFAGLSRVC